MDSGNGFNRGFRLCTGCQFPMLGCGLACNRISWLNCFSSLLGGRGNCCDRFPNCTLSGSAASKFRAIERMRLARVPVQRTSCRKSSMHSCTKMSQVAPSDQDGTSRQDAARLRLGRHRFVGVLGTSPALACTKTSHSARVCIRWPHRAIIQPEPVPASTGMSNRHMAVSVDITLLLSIRDYIRCGRRIPVDLGRDRA